MPFAFFFCFILRHIFYAFLSKLQKKREVLKCAVFLFCSYKYSSYVFFFFLCITQKYYSLYFFSANFLQNLKKIKVVYFRILYSKSLNFFSCKKKRRDVSVYIFLYFYEACILFFIGFLYRIITFDK